MSCPPWCFPQPQSLVWIAPDWNLPVDCKTLEVLPAERCCGNITWILMASYWKYLGWSLPDRKCLLRPVKPLWHLRGVCRGKRWVKDLHWRLSFHCIRSYLKSQTRLGKAVHEGSREVCFLQSQLEEQDCFTWNCSWAVSEQSTCGFYATCNLYAIFSP